MSYMLSYQSIACNALNTYVTDKKLSSLKLRKFLVIVEDYAMVVRIFFFFFFVQFSYCSRNEKGKDKKTGSCLQAISPILFERAFANSEWIFINRSVIWIDDHGTLCSVCKQSYDVY